MCAPALTPINAYKHYIIIKEAIIFLIFIMMHIKNYISFIIYYIYIITTIIDSMYAPASNLRTIFYFIIYIMYLCVFVYAPPRISPKQIHIIYQNLLYKTLCAPLRTSCGPTRIYSIYN